MSVEPGSFVILFMRSPGQRSSTGSINSTSSVKLLGGGWRECRDDVTGDSYYYNEHGEVTWEMPEEFAVLVKAVEEKVNSEEEEEEDDLREGVIAFASPETTRSRLEEREQEIPPAPPPVTPEQEERLAGGYYEEEVSGGGHDQQEQDVEEKEDEDEEDVPMSYLEDTMEDLEKHWRAVKRQMNEGEEEDERARLEVIERERKMKKKAEEEEEEERTTLEAIERERRMKKKAEDEAER